MSAKKCEELEELLEAYARKEISAAEHKTVSHHLESCAGCRKQLRWIEASKAVIRGVPAPAMPADLKRALLDEAARHRRAKEAGWLGRAGEFWRTRPWEIGFAAAFAAAAVVLVGRFYVSDTQPLPLGAVLAAHNDYVRTMPLSSQEPLVPDLSDRIDGEEGDHAL